MLDSASSAIGLSINRVDIVKLTIPLDTLNWMYFSDSRNVCLLYIVLIIALFCIFRKRATRSYWTYWWSTEWNWQVSSFLCPIKNKCLYLWRPWTEINCMCLSITDWMNRQVRKSSKSSKNTTSFASHSFRRGRNSLPKFPTFGSLHLWITHKVSKQKTPSIWVVQVQSDLKWLDHLFEQMEQKGRILQYYALPVST